MVIIQNDIGNRYSPTVICAAITSKINKAKMPTHVAIRANEFELVRDSVVLLEQIRTIDKRRLKDRICHLSSESMARIDTCLLISMGIETDRSEQTQLTS